MAFFPVMASRMFTPCHVLKCEYVNNKGQTKKKYTENETIFYIAFSDFQGTEVKNNDVFVIEKTASICSPFIPNLDTGDCIKLLDTGLVYEIINSPENWNMQNLFLLFKVKRLEGGV